MSPESDLLNTVRVVRSDGAAEEGMWIVSPYQRSSERVTLFCLRGGYNVAMSPSTRVFECWQRGGQCRNTEEHDANCRGDDV